MSTNFPNSVDAFTNPTTSDTLATVSHSGQHSDLNDAVEAVETALLDGAPLHIDDANERVGIGTNNPQTSLHISQTGADALRIQKSNNDQQGSYISMWDDDQRLGYIGYAGNDDLYLENEASAGKTFLSTAGSVRMAIDSSGNVGINDTTPSYTLDVDGDINATGDVRVAGNPVGMVLIMEQTAGTNVSELSLNNVFSSTFYNYLITVHGGTFNTANTQVVGYLVASGSASFSGYKNRLLYSSYTSTTPLAASTTTNQRILWWGGTKANATAPVFCRLNLMGPAHTDGTFMTSDSYGTDSHAGSGTCYHSLTTAYDGFRFGPEAGTMSGCVVRVYGYN